MSLTLLMISFIGVIVAGVLQLMGKILTPGVIPEVFYSASALYFGRRLNVGGKPFTADKAEQLEKKLESAGTDQ